MLQLSVLEICSHLAGAKRDIEILSASEST